MPLLLVAEPVCKLGGRVLGDPKPNRKSTDVLHQLQRAVVVSMPLGSFLRSLGFCRGFWKRILREIEAARSGRG